MNHILLSYTNTKRKKTNFLTTKKLDPLSHKKWTPYQVLSQTYKSTNHPIPTTTTALAIPLHFPTTSIPPPQKPLPRHQSPPYTIKTLVPLSYLPPHKGGLPPHHAHPPHPPPQSTEAQQAVTRRRYWTYPNQTAPF